MFLILAATTWLFRLTANKQAIARTVLIAATVILALFTWQRNSVWKSEISLWTDVLNKAPNLARAYVNLGKAYGEKGNHLKTENLLRNAISLAPNDGHAYLSLGASLENQNKLLPAIKTYNQALILKKGIDRAKLQANLSGAYLKLGNLDMALHHGQESLTLNRFRLQPYLTLSAVNFKLGRMQEAEKLLHQAITLFPNKGDLYVQLGSIYENQNRLAETVSALNTALSKTDVNLVQAYNNLGIVFWRQKLLEQSKTAAEMALKLDPNFLDAYLTLGITYEDMGYQDLAIAQFRKGWQLGLDMVDIYNNWAVNFMKMNKVDRALIYLQEAVKLDPNSIESFDNLAQAFMLKNMYREAEKARNSAQRLRKNN
jgi:tetratricopeptide (TPR) repeat protein